MRLFIEAVKGLGVTMKHFFLNMFYHILRFFHLSHKKGETVTTQYPEEKRETFTRVRLRHRLLSRDDGRLRCVACYMCATACPAQCIYIEAEEDPRNPLEKKPKQFIINLGRCAYCGFCVEACPEDALRMDVHVPEISEYKKEDLLYDIDKLTHW